MLSFGLTFCGTGGGDSGIDNFGMTDSCGLTVSIAVTAAAGVGGIALFCTGRSSYHTVVLMDMVQSGDLLCFGFITDSTGIGLHTLRSLGGLGGDDTVIPAVTHSRDGFLGGQDCVTDRAVLALGLTFCGTGGGDSGINSFCMAEGHNLAGFIVITVFTFPAFGSISDTGWLDSNTPCAETVSQGRSFCIVTAVTFAFSRLGASGSF